MGSRNPVKLGAAREAFRLLGATDVVGVSVETSVPDQPVGACEVFRGALERALRALKGCGGKFGVGIESGLIPMPSPTGFLVAQGAVIVGPGGRVSGGLSGGFEVPSSVSEKMLEGVEMAHAFEVGRSLEDVGESIGYIGLASWGIVTRRELTLHALHMAITPWLNGGSWLPSVEEYRKRLSMICSV